MTNRKLVGLIVVLAIVFPSAPSSAVAAFVVDIKLETVNQNGATIYKYTISNSSASTLNVEDFTLDVSPDANLSVINGPQGWSIDYRPGDQQIIWYADFPGSEIARGSSGTFTFTSALSPVSSSYQIFGIDTDGQDFDIFSGMVLSPGRASVPEPTSMILLGTGLIAVGGYSRHRSRSSPAVIRQKTAPLPSL